MALLLDTHTFLWFIGNHPRLSRVAADRIADPGEIVLVSVVNAWEIVIKMSTGKLTLDKPVAEIWRNAVLQDGFGVLDVTTPHVLALEELPMHHRDPFDRLLIAQAIAEGYQIVSADAAFDAYPVDRVW